MRTQDEGRSNAAHWYERAMKAEAELDRLRAERDAVIERLKRHATVEDWKFIDRLHSGAAQHLAQEQHGANRLQEEA